MSHWGKQTSSLPLKRQDGFAAPQELWELTFLTCSHTLLFLFQDDTILNHLRWVRGDLALLL